MQADNISTVSNTELRKIPSATFGDWPKKGTFKSWYSLYERDTTDESNHYFKELKAQLLKDLQRAKHEQDEVENNCIFVKKWSYPAGLDEVKENLILVLQSSDLGESTRPSARQPYLGS